MPKLSIITINLNNLAGLQKTMQSVFEQSFTDYEYVIIDGGSMDGSKELIENNAKKLVYWISEKDSGIFNAMNKGIDVSKGQYLLFLNSGDYLYNPSVLSSVFINENCPDIIYGNVIWTPKNFHGEYPDKLNFEHFLYNTIPHQGSFIKRYLFEKIGKYEEEFSVNSDWNFFVLAIFKFNCSYYHIHSIISFCDTGGISLTPEGFKKSSEIRSAFIDRHFRHFFSDYKDFMNSKKDIEYYKNLMEHRIMKNAFKINKIYLRFKKIFKS